MGLKNYLAAFLILVFLGKLVTIDSKIMGIIFNASEVTLVNKMCPKKQLQTEVPVEYSKDHLASSFEIDYLCHTPVHIRLHESSDALTEIFFRKYSYRLPEKFSVPGEKFYPPPQA